MRTENPRVGGSIPSLATITPTPQRALVRLSWCNYLILKGTLSQSDLPAPRRAHFKRGSIGDNSARSYPQKC